MSDIGIQQAIGYAIVRSLTDLKQWSDQTDASTARVAIVDLTVDIASVFATRDDSFDVGRFLSVLNI